MVVNKRRSIDDYRRWLKVFLKKKHNPNILNPEIAQQLFILDEEQEIEQRFRELKEKRLELRDYQLRKMAESQVHQELKKLASNKRGGIKWMIERAEKLVYGGWRTEMV